MSGLPREVIKWLQSLDLTHPVKNVRRDFSNGYLIAEIFSWYYPHVLEMHSFTNGMSLQAKQGNWQQLERFFIKEKLDVPKEFIDGTIHCKPGAAKALLEKAYTLLTLKELRYVPCKTQPEDFTDQNYQTQLPPHARSTTTQSIKTNLANSELEMEPDRITCMMKAQSIVEAHEQQKRQEKEEYPERFGVKRINRSPQQKSKDNTDAVTEIKVAQKLPPQLV